MQNSLPKRIHDDRNGLDYILQGDYYFPVIEDPSETRPIGKWGRLRLKFLMESRPILYNQMILNGTIQAHLVEINETANRRLERMIPEMAKAEGVDENLKDNDQMEWVRRMNSVRQRAGELIIDELIFN